MRDCISVIIPYKNGEEFIEENFKTISQQKTSSFDIQVILINDHSNSKSSDIAKKLCESYRFEYCTNEGNGIIDALKTGLRKSTGNYITRMDADDLMPKDKLSLLHALLSSDNSIDVATGKVSYFSTNKEMADGYLRYADWLNDRILKGDYYSEIYKECPVASPNWMIRRELFEKHNIVPTHYPEDYDMVFRFYKEKLNIQGVEETTHLWRDHNDRTSRNSETYSDNGFLYLKCRWFLTLDYLKDKKLIIYGAGKKGKKLAAIMNGEELPYQWITSNPRKVGHQIYGVKLESDSDVELNDECQILVAVSGPDDLSDIKNQLNHLEQGRSVFYFF